MLRRKIQEKDQHIEEALKKMDFAEEDYLWLLKKKMRDLRPLVYRLYIDYSPFKGV